MLYSKFSFHKFLNISYPKYEQFFVAIRNLIMLYQILQFFGFIYAQPAHDLQTHTNTHTYTHPHTVLVEFASRQTIIALRRRLNGILQSNKLQIK